MASAIARQAGARPKNTPVISAISAAKLSTRTSGPTSSAIGVRVVSKNPTRYPHAAYASPTPSTAPASETERLCPATAACTRPRPAPIDSRTAISWRRLLARASSRFATLTHAVNSTSPLIASSTVSGSPYSLAHDCQTGARTSGHRGHCFNWAIRRRRSQGELGFHHGRMKQRLSSALASSRLRPDRTRPTSWSQLYPASDV